MGEEIDEKLKAKAEEINKQEEKYLSYLKAQNEKFDAEKAKQDKEAENAALQATIDKAVEEKIKAMNLVKAEDKPEDTGSEEQPSENSEETTEDSTGSPEETNSVETLKAQNEKLQEELKKFQAADPIKDPLMGDDTSGHQVGVDSNMENTEEQKIISASLNRWKNIPTSYEESGKRVSVRPTAYSNENFMKAYTEFGRDALYNYSASKYDNQPIEEGLFQATDPDASCPLSTGDWEMADCFANEIWFGVLCKSDFLGKIGHRKYDYHYGCGMKLQIRLLTIASPSQDWTVTTSSTPCDCLTCVSDTLSTYEVTIHKYGDYRVLCDEHFMRAGEELRGAIISGMKQRLADRIDNEVYGNLSGATPGYTQSLGAVCGGSRLTDGDCCTYAVDLYDKVISLEADMREGGYFQDAEPVLIVSPTVARYLKFKDGLSIPSYMASMIKFNGIKLIGIGNIKVIESCHANTCVTTASAVQAILIDPSRAFSEVWAKQPTFEFKREPKCGSEDVVVWAYASFDVLDTNAIGHILNP